MISAGQCRYEGIKLEILKSFSLVFALSTSILHFAIAFVALASLSVNMPLFKKGGIFTETPFRARSYITKPSSAKTISPAVR